MLSSTEFVVVSKELFHASSKDARLDSPLPVSESEVLVP